jgi:hypothetical protein
MTPRRSALLLAIPLALASGCGGGDVENAPAQGARKLSFAYFQRCVMPILVTQLPVTLNGVTTQNNCASAGCHDDTNGTGGALRVRGSAGTVVLTTAPDLIRATDMYRNFYSAQGEVVFGDALASRLIAKPLVRNVLHGGGIVFTSESDANVRIMRYWIENPMPEGQDEFSSAANSLFTPQDAATGACNTL